MRANIRNNKTKIMKKKENLNPKVTYQVMMNKAKAVIVCVKKNKKCQIIIEEIIMNSPIKNKKKKRDSKAKIELIYNKI